MNHSEEQILEFAPDESSRKSGKELANAGKWLTRGANARALWGECQGSGSKPYLAQVDLTNIAFKCTCPSRKFPCKHGLGLLLLYAKDKNSFTITDAPAWVIEWLNNRTAKQEKQSDLKEKPVDEAAQAKRQQARQSKVNNGIEELRAWLKDIIRNGIMSIPEKGSSFFENMSRRLVDAQAPGLAGMVRSLGEINFYTEGWPTRFTDQILRIYMIIEGFKHSTSLNELFQEDIKTCIGFTQNQEELKEKSGVKDKWLVLGKQVSEIDAVTTEKFWLYGTKSNNYAFLLQFLVRGQGVQLNLIPGTFVEAELIYFPSVLPQRALIKGQIATSAVTELTTLQNWEKAAELEAELNSISPFRSERAFILNKLKPVQYNQQWWLQDVENNIMLLKNEEKYIWKLLSLSGGQPMDMAVIGKEDMFEPLGVWQDNEYKII